MTFAQLRTFVVVAETGSVRRAAERLVVSQPAVSAAIAALQREVGVALVAREGRGVVITPAGQRYAAAAREILGLLDGARAAAVGQARPEQGRVRIAAVTTAGEHVLPGFLASFRVRFPEAEVVLEVGNRARVGDLLEHREVDLAIGGRPPGGGRYASIATRANPLVVVAQAARGRRCRPRQVAVGDLAAEVWLLREHGSGTRATTEELFEQHGIAPRTLTVGSNGAIRECVRAGLGITLVSRDAASRELREGTLEEWRAQGLPLERTWHVVARATEELPATAQLFLDDLVGNDEGSLEPFHLGGMANEETPPTVD